MQHRWSYVIFIIWPSTRENLSSRFANNKGADKAALLCIMISVSVICYVEGIVVKLAL